MLDHDEAGNGQEANRFPGRVACRCVLAREVALRRQLLPRRQLPLRMVMEILGHSEIATTSDIYTQMPARYREVADALDACLTDDVGDDDESSDGL